METLCLLIVAVVSARTVMAFILQKPDLLVNPLYPNCPAQGAHSKAGKSAPKFDPSLRLRSSVGL